MPSDLTFQQLKDALPSNAVVVSNGSAPLSAGVYLNFSNLSGQTIDELTDTGVVESLVKLLRGASSAQASVNTNVVSPNRLSAFPTPTFSAPTLDTTTNEYTATITVAVTGKAPLNLDSLSGGTI